MISIRRGTERGQTSLSWLDSRHTFSFGYYYDYNHMGVSHLRVLNDDRVKPGAGFDTHGHKDMEIISYVLEGAIEHRDSTGEQHVLPAGELQLMRAGTGIAHSEFNASRTNPLRFLQIWIIPRERGLAPGYQQKRFFSGDERGIKRVVNPEGSGGALQVAQDVSLYIARLDAGATLPLALAPGRVGYLHLVKGRLAIGTEKLAENDGASFEAGDLDQAQVEQDAELLLFDLPDVSA